MACLLRRSSVFPSRVLSRRGISSRLNGITIEHTSMGNIQDPAVLLIAGAAASMNQWMPFDQQLADAGFRVIKFDNRDVGKLIRSFNERCNLRTRQLNPFKVSVMYAAFAPIARHFYLSYPMIRKEEPFETRYSNISSAIGKLTRTTMKKAQRRNFMDSIMVRNDSRIFDHLTNGSLSSSLL